MEFSQKIWPVHLPCSLFHNLDSRSYPDLPLPLIFSEDKLKRHEGKGAHMLKQIICNYLGMFGFSGGLLLYYWLHDKPQDFFQKAFPAIVIWGLLDTLKLLVAYRKAKQKGGKDENI